VGVGVGVGVGVVHGVHDEGLNKTDGVVSLVHDLTLTPSET